MPNDIEDEPTVARTFFQCFWKFELIVGASEERRENPVPVSFLCRIVFRSF